ncbi:MAG: hypothetical protein JWM07_674 [Candidatus Saccharibacteria bacterium]|nr:hypothetical protein [Candidatus Saccharibacteria bacterium]
MYSGTTFRTKSGLVMGVHQKIDRVAHRHIKHHVPKTLHFPTTQEVLHFEGLNGPDGIKRKSPAKDEPWHYIDPKNPEDQALITMINDHIYNMAEALKVGNNERAAFEAAWMAHAITDGLTPAHHYPLEAKLEELRGGQGIETRITTKDKLLLPGKTRRHQIKNNWEYWGVKGVMTTHLGFELGVATTIAGLKMDGTDPREKDYKAVRDQGYEAVFKDILAKVDGMNMYDEFSKLGWTRHLATQTKKALVPDIIKAVTLAWYQAIIMAEKK